MRYFLLLFILGLASLPTMSLAAVTINEVAWMGDNVSANHEWIELYNDSQTAVVVDGWTLSDGMNLAITLAGTISPLSYAVLERTSEDSAPGTAFLLYTGALVNSGATLRLVDSNGALQDQVAGGENWQGIGGDNVSKETAQYTTNGWQSSVPTPGKANTTVTTIVPNNNPPSTTGSGSNNKTATTINTKPKVTKLGENKNGVELTMTVKTLAYVNERIDFSVTARRSDATTINSLKYTWNFGDLNSDTGARVKHLYQYPGTYVVTLKTRYDGQDELVRQEITILPVTMSLARNEAGDVQIQNNAPYEMDISGYQLSGTRSLIIPDDTIILPRGTITIPRIKLEDLDLLSLVVLYDATRQAVAYNKPADVAAFGFGTKKAEELRSNSSASKPVATLNTVSVINAKTTKTATSETLFDPSTNGQPQTKVETTKTTEPPVKSENKNWPYFALIGLIAFGLIIVWRSPTAKKQATIFD